ncbi:bifunctional acetyl-CoA hydrolase/transferase family protein/GNAT family N-acetyltransferase [Desulforhopalus sp. IMCC35007]|uniref:bifunctional acetyl-CoA hydrolase/transferase family protein/GNAT family N-acetyltransferase n=1 Tax=Desulforhopalus sp. IMCC35007 TaxID=2569543 RepID=UPI0010AE4EE6|nr:bifunctional acetyl-CoA hydrolase/transferase family protein/GNAT family N-acetyltransferase [Desulforhopalus sp. IMCC35007]TKB09129.1 GNAT family N-acetyltransferase [Desulforhopalus sp. IMCC35007]
MPNTEYWADTYLEKAVTAEKAISKIRSGQRVFIGSGCGEPQILTKTLVEKTNNFSGLEIVRLLGMETASLTAIADRTKDTNLNIRSIYLGSTKVQSIAKQRRFITPMNMSDVPMLFTTRKLPLHVALVQVSPPDDFGWMSLGVSVDVTLAAARSADFVIAQVNPFMPRVMGQSFIHVNDVNLIVEHEEALLAIPPSAVSSPAAIQIGQHIAKLIEDGSTLQIGLDAASQATVQALSDKNDLGVHSQFLTDDIMHLYATGNINNKKKGLNDGKMVASMAIGSHNLYEFLNDNPAVDFHPSDYVNDPFVISQHNKMISMNVASTMDLTGQVSTTASAATRYAGVSGIPDFVRGARRSRGGKSILMLFSTTETPDGLRSNIVPQLNDEVTVVPRGDVHYVISEYGAVNLFGKSIQERTIAMISIAHPDFRDELFQAAKDKGYIGSERTLGEASKAVYPVNLEETLIINGEKIFIRPSKPVDERRIQEHYYSLPKEDVLTRFFCQKTIFGRTEMESRSHVDYVNDLTLVAVVGEFGFGKVVAVAESMKITGSNISEVAFSVSEEYQGKGLGTFFIKKLAAVARENGISGLTAYTFPSNKAMIALFKTLPYKVKTVYEDGDLVLSCKFNELAD